MAPTEWDSETDPTSELMPVSTVRRFDLEVVEGTGAGTFWRSKADRCAIGAHPSNDMVLDDSQVSRFHCELTVDAAGVRVRDLGSRNGTTVDAIRVIDGYLRDGSLLRVGRTTLRLRLSPDQNCLPLSEHSLFGPLVGRSVAMRAAFAMLERAAQSEATVLIEGETGTGKEGTAAAVHEAGPRKSAPFVIVDCSSMPAGVLESELFGHERGSFTGAADRRIGAFEQASGGTVFIDEVGELPLDLQPKLLRVLERRHIRRVGANEYIPTDVRIIAATNRDLRGEVNAGRFRSDLYYRLAVVKVRLPALRERLEDLELLTEHILNELSPTGTAEPWRTPEFMARLRTAAWPGNVRELRNYLERCLLFQESMPMAEVTPASNPPATRFPGAGTEADISIGYSEAKRRMHDAWEVRYIQALLAAHDSNVDQAARAAGLAASYLYRLMKRHGLRPSRRGSQPPR
jgi:DNA-binding NtrC family response regulator